MSEYIAHYCPGCYSLVYIVDGKTFADPQYNQIVNCWNCGQRLMVPPALRTQNETLKNWSDEHPEPGGLWGLITGRTGKK